MFLLCNDDFSLRAALSLLLLCCCAACCPDVSRSSELINRSMTQRSLWCFSALQDTDLSCCNSLISSPLPAQVRLYCLSSTCSGKTLLSDFSDLHISAGFRGEEEKLESVSFLHVRSQMWWVVMFWTDICKSVCPVWSWIRSGSFEWLDVVSSSRSKDWTELTLRGAELIQLHEQSQREWNQKRIRIIQVTVKTGSWYRSRERTQIWWAGTLNTWLRKYHRNYFKIKCNQIDW